MVLCLGQFEHMAQEHSRGLGNIDWRNGGQRFRVVCFVSFTMVQILHVDDHDRVPTREIF